MRNKLLQHSLIVTHYKPDILHEKPDILNLDIEIFNISFKNSSVSHSKEDSYSHLTHVILSTLTVRRVEYVPLVCRL